MSRGWVLAVVLGAACSRVDPSPPTLDAIAEGYVKAALQLAQHNPLLVEDWWGPETWRPGPRTPVKPIVEKIETLQRDLARRPERDDERDRRDYLDAQLRALRFAGRRLLGTETRFDEEARAALEVSVPPINAEVTAAARDALAAELPGRGTLTNRLAQFRQRFIVPGGSADDVMRQANDICRAGTHWLEGEEQLDFEFVSGIEFDGVAKYLGTHHTRISINRDASLDITRALHLACHEGYQGHHRQFLLIDEFLVKRNGWKEFALVPAFGRHVLVTEGSAEAATAFALPPARRRTIYREQLFPAAGLEVGDVDRLVRVEELVTTLEPLIADVIRGYLDNTLTQAAAADRLRDEALIANPETLLAFAERHRTRILAYQAGKEIVMRDVQGAGFVRLFVDRPFSIR